MLKGHLEKLRQHEFETVRPFLKPGIRVLEIGGGSGYQASCIAAEGCDVVSIDIADRPVPAKSWYPVQDYDGRNIPAAEKSFDLVFSSNVLEHVQGLPELLSETRRVLRPGGLAVHVLPSAVWRFWNSAVWYPALANEVLLRCLGKSQYAQASSVASNPHKGGLVKQFCKTVLLGPWRPHGEYPNAVAELYYFSQIRWMRLFQENGFVLHQVFPNKLFYTGWGCCFWLPFPVRRQLSKVLGSACNVFVLGIRSST